MTKVNSLQTALCQQHLILAVLLCFLQACQFALNLLMETVSSPLDPDLVKIILEEAGKAHCILYKCHKLRGNNAASWSFAYSFMMLYSGASDPTNVAVRYPSFHRNSPFCLFQHTACHPLSDFIGTTLPAPTHYVLSSKQRE